MDLAIPFQIFGRIFEFDAVLLEKFVNFQAGFKTKKPTQLGGCELTFTICLEGDRLQSGTRQISAGEA